MNVIAPICIWMSGECRCVTDRGLPKMQFVWQSSLCYSWIPRCGSRMDRKFHFKMIIRFKLPHVITCFCRNVLGFFGVALVPSVRNPTDVHYHVISITINFWPLTALHNTTFSLSVLHTISTSEVIFFLYHSK